jgi:hypothetical protein
MPPSSREAKGSRRAGLPHPGKTNPETMTPRIADGTEQGSAVVEFTFLSLLLMVPLVYFIITVGLSRVVES